MAKKDLRKQAESAARAAAAHGLTVTDAETQRLLHELQVHHIELEMQNEELRAAQLESERAHHQYHELFEAAPAGYVMLDSAGQIIRANASAARMLDAPLQRLLGRRLTYFVDHQEHTRVNDHLNAVRMRARDMCEVRLSVRERAPYLVRLDSCLLPSSPSECLVVLTDMSERQRHQDELEHLNRALESRVAKRTAELAAQNEMLQAEIRVRTQSEETRRELEVRLRSAERLQSLGMLAAGIAHDFNNLLMGVLGNTELLMMTPELPSEWREPLDLIQRTACDAAELTRQLLVFAGQGRVEPSAVDLGAVASECFALLRARRDKDVELRLDLVQNLPPVAADRAQLQRVVINLVTNAIEALSARGQVTLHAAARRLDLEQLAQFQYADSARPGDFVVMQVSDTGRGIDAASVTRIFDPFFSTKFTGRGLGLATVLGIVQSYAGAIRVSSQLGNGTCFELALPRWTSTMPSVAASNHEPLAWQGSGAVLLIDDDAVVRPVVAALLRELGFEVTAAESGEAGLAAFRGAGSGFALVVLDWLMPGLSGEQTLYALRQLSPSLPVVVISGYSADMLNITDAHTVRLQKPMMLEQLRTAAHAVLTAQPAPPAVQHR